MNERFPIPRADEYLDLLDERLPGKTFNHVKSVAEFMLTYSDQAKITQEQAVTAGLLHDLCKPLKKDELIAAAHSYGITNNLDTPNLLHGPVAAKECVLELNIDDNETLEAIKYHTTGKRHWSNTGCALYLADFAEPLRTIPEAKKARDILVEKDFTTALRFVVQKRNEFVREKYPPNENAQAFHDWIMNGQPNAD